VGKMKLRKKSRLVKTSQKRENVELDYMPGQGDDTICLYQTSPDFLENLERSEDLREGLIRLKQKFLWEIQEWTKRFGIKTEVRVFYTLNPEE